MRVVKVIDGLGNECRGQGVDGEETTQVLVFNKEGRIRIERTAIKILAKKLLQMRADRTAYR